MPDMFELDGRGRVTAPEGKTLEFKRDLSSPVKPLRTIVAFANSAGGRLVIGVDDDGSVLGVADPLAEEERVSNLIADSITPRLIPAVDLVPLGGTTVLVIDVPLSTSRPHFLSAQGIDNGTYVRLGSTNRKADASLIADIERSARGLRFEDAIDERATLADLDLSALPDVDDRKITQADLVPLGLAAVKGDVTVPTNAGLLATSPHPDRFIASAWVQCGRIRGAHRTDIVDRMEYHGPMPGAVEPIMAFLRKHAYLAAEFGEARRKDVWSIPIEPLREIVVNALVHANYAEPGTPVRVAFYDDRIEVESPGLLVAGMTVAGMRGASRLRNPSLARIFRAAGLMENFGTGVRRVYEQLAAGGLPEPSVEEVVDRVRFTVHIRSHAPERRTGGNDQQHTYTERSNDRYVGRYDVVMLRAALDGPAHRNDLLDAAGLGHLSQNYTRHIAPLVSDGLLELTVPDRPRSKTQRYRITDSGRAFVAANEERA